MKVTVVSSADIAAMPGQPLSAEFWCDREEGETYDAWKRRREAGRLEALADEMTARAAGLREEARAVLAGERPPHRIGPDGRPR